MWARADRDGLTMAGPSIVGRAGQGATRRGRTAGRIAARINDQWRICFRWKDGEAHEVEIIDYH